MCTHTVETFMKFAVHKVCIDWNIVRWIIIQRWTAEDNVGKPSSCLPCNLEQWDEVEVEVGNIFCHSNSSDDACFIFGFVVFYLWVNSANIILWQTRHAGSFQILCLGSCPLSTNQWSVWQNTRFLASLIRRSIYSRSIWVRLDSVSN